MSKPIAAVLIAAAVTGTLAATPAQAFDILALRTLGFSPDGRYFAFMQYGPQWEASKLFAETSVIDAGTDRYLPGTPARISNDMKDDADSDNIGPELKAFLARADKRNAALIGKLKIGKPGVVLVRVPEARVDDYEHTTDKPPPGPGAATVKASHPQLGELTLTLDVREADWPKSSRLYAGKEAPSCAEEMDPANGATALQAPWNGGNNQQWRLNDMGNGRYQIINRGTGTGLDSGGDATIGSRVKLWTPDASTNLQWTIIAV